MCSTKYFRKFSQKYQNLLKKTGFSLKVPLVIMNKSVIIFISSFQSFKNLGKLFSIELKSWSSFFCMKGWCSFCTTVECNGWLNISAQCCILYRNQPFFGLLQGSHCSLWYLSLRIILPSSSKIPVISLVKFWSIKVPFSIKLFILSRNDCSNSWSRDEGLYFIESPQSSVKSNNANVSHLWKAYLRIQSLTWRGKQHNEEEENIMKQVVFLAWVGIVC